MAMFKFLFPVVCCLLLVCNGYSVVGDSWNLNADWDTVHNPSAPWTYHQNSGTAFTVFGAWGGPDFPLGETGWKLPGKPAHLGMSKVTHNSSQDLTHTYSYAAGSVIGHTNENFGAKWTATEAGTYLVSGVAHKIRNGMGSVFVKVLVNGVQQSMFKLNDSGLGQNKDNPYTFSYVVILGVNSVVDLVLTANGENGDFGSIANYTIEQIPSDDRFSYYVSPDGNDDNDGSEQSPFATIGRARQAVQTRIALGMTEDIVVYLREGVYYLDETLVFGPQDSGANGFKVIYTVYPGESPVLSGGQPLTGWTSIGGNKYTVTLPEVAAGNWWFRQLWADGLRCQRARWPNPVSQSSNPNEVWSYSSGGGPSIPAANMVFSIMNTLQSDWLPEDLHDPLSQPAWSPGSVPGLAKSMNNQPYGLNILRGDVFGHGSYIVRWTSPANMQVRVTGNAWRLRNSDWLDVWALENGDWNNNTTNQRHHIGTIPFGSYPRSAPLNFGQLVFNVVAGQEVQLVVAGNDFAGVNMTVENTSTLQTWDLKSDWPNPPLFVESVSGDYKTLTMNQNIPGSDFAGHNTELVLYHTWASSRARMSQDPSGSSITTDTVCGLIGHGGGALEPKPGELAYLEHHPDYIDQPTEWYLDSTTGVLTYQAPVGINPNDSRIIAPRLQWLVKIEGTETNPVRNIVFKGLSFKHTKWDLPEIGYAPLQASVHLTPGAGEDAYIVPLAVQLSYADNCKFENCHFTNIAQTAIGFAQGVNNCSVINNEFNDIGGSGIMAGYRGGSDINGAIFAGSGNAISDWSDPADVPTGNIISNNYIHDCAAEWHGCVGIEECFTKQTQISQNIITDLPYTGLLSGFNWSSDITSEMGTVIQQNHIFDVMKVLNDGGGIYTLGNHQGGLIKGNLVYDVYANVGLYSDQGSSYFTVEDNIVYNCKDTYYWHCNWCIESTFTWGANYWDDDHGSPGQPQWIIDAAGVEPNVPVLNISMPDCGNILVTGNCEPWAQIDSAVIQETLQDISGYLTIGENGSISGMIPKTFIPSDMATVEIVVSDPEGHLSAAGISNSVELMRGDINADCVVDFADLVTIAGQWLASGCIAPEWCSGTDLDQSGKVDLQDFSLFGQDWLLSQ